MTAVITPSVRRVRLIIGWSIIVIGIGLLWNAWRLSTHRAPVSHDDVASQPADDTRKFRRILIDRLPGVAATVRLESQVAIVTLPLEAWALSPATARDHFLSRAALIIEPLLQCDVALTQVTVIGTGVISRADQKKEIERLFEVHVMRDALTDPGLTTASGVEHRNVSLWSHARYQ